MELNQMAKGYFITYEENGKRVVYQGIHFDNKSDADDYLSVLLDREKSSERRKRGFVNPRVAKLSYTNRIVRI
jgi:hypothetical protein